LPTIQIWVPDCDMDILRKLKEYFENLVDEEFEGKAWLVDRPRFGKGRRIRRPRINDSYVVRQAIHKLKDEIEMRLEEEKRERERNAKHLVYGSPPSEKKEYVWRKK
jgi:hypothetical protein